MQNMNEIGLVERNYYSPYEATCASLLILIHCGFEYPTIHTNVIVMWHQQIEEELKSV